MSKPGADDDDRYRNAERALGGADGVEKTTFSSNAHGTEPGGSADQRLPVTAPVPSDGPGPLVWVVIALALIAFLGYSIWLLI